MLDIIKNKIQAKNLSQKDIALALDISEAQVSRFINCKSSLSMDKFLTLLSFLGLKIK